VGIGAASHYRSLWSVLGYGLGSGAFAYLVARARRKSG